MLRLSTPGAEFIAHFEGFSPVCYRCPAGYETIGFGHRIRPGETLVRVTYGEALDLLMQDADREAAPVDAALKVAVNTHEADAIISLAFNAGGYAIARSTLVKKLNAGDKSGAADEFLRWNKANRKVLGGLVRRRNAERRVFLFADYEQAGQGDI